MTKLTITKDTYLKPSEGQYSSVGGEAISAGKVLSGNIGRKDGHYVTSDGLYIWHKAAELDSNADWVTLSVPYHSQRNNKYAPSGSCLHTSLAMCLNYLGKDTNKDDKLQLEDEIYEKMLARDIPRGYHDLIGALVTKNYGVSCKFDTNTPFKSLRAHLSKGFPGYISAKYTRSGHITAVCGYNYPERYWLINDPWGNYNKGYKNDHNGKMVKYSFDTIASVNPNGPSSSEIWAMLVTPK